MTAGSDSVVSVSWSMRPEEGYILGLLTEMEVAVVAAGWEVIDTLRKLPRAQIPEEVRDCLEALEWVESVYEMRQSQLRETNTEAPESRQTA